MTPKRWAKSFVFCFFLVLFVGLVVTYYYLFMIRKTKISHDPNNTNWTRSTSGFGHKILSSQGWTPGSFLGARNAPHADMFTAASASHIKASVKDDTLGLGARPKGNLLDEPTGLDAFKGLLGRLNGKADQELESEQRKREDLKLARYTATRWNAINFVSGGLLVQEKMDVLTPKTPRDSQTRDTQDGACHERKKDKGNDNSDAHNSQAVKTLTSESSKKKRSKKTKRSRENVSGSEEKRKKKSKKRKHDSENDGTDSEAQVEESQNPADSQGATAVSKERRPIGRHMFRGRHIEQKKRALLNDKSLNEIFMAKS